MVSSGTATTGSQPLKLSHLSRRPADNRRFGGPAGLHTDLVGLVEEQAEVGEDHPQLLPAVTVLELPQEVTRQLVLQQGAR